MSKLTDTKERGLTVIYRLDHASAEWLRKQLATRRPSRVKSVNQMARFLIREQAGTLGNK